MSGGELLQQTERSDERRQLIALNRDCHCFPIEREQVDAAILSLGAHPDMANMLAKRANYFAKTGVFLAADDLVEIQAQITAIEQTIARPEFQSLVLARKDKPALHVQTETRGAFMGYDFHLTADGPRLIEINSNAGGAFIVGALEHAIRKPHANSGGLIAKMFRSEWRRAGRTEPLETIAIIDESPEAQFHYPDMCLAQILLEGHGYNIVIADPSQLSYEAGKLMIEGKKIDLIYNRLTDFELSNHAHAPILSALRDDAVVVTPNPRHHALYADKSNLAILTDRAELKKLGVPESTQTILSQIPKTVVVTDETADMLWKNRKQYFFKPHSGFGSRAAYRGAKLTTKVWQHIKTHNYVAQAFVSPPLRAIPLSAGADELKFDLRVYTYDGDMLLLAARIYQGQTTNLRTDGGGLAPVIMCEATVNCMAAE